jgi:formate dehydrogenase subunit delta
VTTQRLVQMANQVASFFASYPEAEAIDGTANHLKAYWDPRMRREMAAHLNDKAGAGLSHIAMEAVKRMVARDAAKDAAKKSA